MNGLYLDSIIVKDANKISINQLNEKYINQMAIKCKISNSNNDYKQLAKILYRKCFVGNKINRTLKGSHIPYCSKEDFFGIFCLVLYNCVNQYDNTKGDFQNYFLKMYSLALANEKKQSFLKINGKTSDVVNKKGFATSVSTSDIDISKDFEFETEKNMMNQTMIETLKTIPDGELLIYKYLTNLNKPKSNQEVAEKFNLTQKQVRLRLKKASNIFKSENPTYLSDYFYDEKDENDCGCIVSISSVAEAA